MVQTVKGNDTEWPMEAGGTVGSVRDGIKLGPQPGSSSSTHPASESEIDNEIVRSSPTNPTPRPDPSAFVSRGWAARGRVRGRGRRLRSRRTWPGSTRLCSTFLMSVRFGSSRGP